MSAASTAKRPMRRRLWRRAFVSVLLVTVLGVNGLAFVQAWSMTHFVAEGTRTERPEALSLGRKVWVLFTGVRIPRPQNDSDPASIGLSFQTRHVRANGVDLEVWSIPADKPPRGLVLMYHAYVASKSSLLPAAQRFHRMGYDLELVDFRGSGGSSGNSTTHGYREADDVAATVADARRHLFSPHQQIVLYGQSMGAAAMLRAIGDLGVFVDGIIIESPYDRLLSTADNRFHAMHLPAFPLARLLVFWGGLQQGYSGFAMNPAESATRVHCPALMFHGQLDVRVTPEQARSVFANLAGPKQLEWYADAGHTSFLSTDPARWENAVSKLLSEARRNGTADEHR
jgi:hypothetical protein